MAPADDKAIPSDPQANSNRVQGVTQTSVTEKLKRVEPNAVSTGSSLLAMQKKLTVSATYADPLANASFHDRISICEPRLALSASIGADLLIESLAATPLGSDSFASQPSSSSPNPLSDADTIRERYSLDGTGQSVAVIDSGVAWNHIAFANAKSGPTGGGFGAGYRVAGGWDFAENDADPYDDGPSGFHGTHVAGTLAGLGDGFAGIAPGADIIALRVFDDFGRGSLDWIESALRWVIDRRSTFANPITTVNLSLGAFATDTSQPLSQLDDELRTLHDEGVIVVAAAGNSFNNAHPHSLAYPASNPLVAAVTSVDASGAIHGFAQRDDGVFAAPGGSVRSALPDHVYGIDGKIDDFGTADGTSMATPQLAGAAVLVRQAMQSLGSNPTPDDILNHLRATADNRTDALSGSTYRVLDLEAAIESLQVRSQDETVHPGETGQPASPLQWTTPSSLVVRTEAEADRIILDLSAAMTISVNSVVYPIGTGLESLQIEGGDGSDSLEIIGSSADERFIARAALSNFESVTAALQRTGLTANFSSFETIVFRGGGGDDRATLFDSAGDDTLEADSNQASLRGVGYAFVAIDVNSLYAYGTAGGSDAANLYDSAGDDQLAIRHQFTSLRSDTLFRIANGFELVNAYASAGGTDRANLYDSPGDDRMSASDAVAWISGRDYYAGARGFDIVQAEATAGGHDYATVYSTDPSANWTRSGSLLQWSMPNGTSRIAQGFEVAESYIRGQKTEVIPQSIRYAFHDDERKASRDFFASLDQDEA